MAVLQGRIAVVTGASRGVGRGIAEGLGELGATVYVTGRSVRGVSTTDDMPGTIDETAERVTQLGGRGIAVRCDHSDDAQVEALFQRVATDEGGLDLLVNNAWGGYERWSLADWEAPFWEEPLRWWGGMITSGLRAHYMASRLAVPRMLGRKTGLIVNISASNAGEYMGSVIYQFTKVAVDTMAWAIAQELREHGIAAISLHPGFTRTEMVTRHFYDNPSLSERFGELEEVTHTPIYVGRAIGALAADPDVMRKTGQTLLAGKLALEYGFTDVDGRQPQWPPASG